VSEASLEPKPYVAPIVGTDRLGRGLSDDERAYSEALLREHDFAGARLVALRFAFKLRRSIEGAQDLMGRACVRLVRQGWDPNEVTLVKCLCRYVWSEAAHETRENETARHATEIFLREMGETYGKSAPSPEDIAAEHQERFDARARAATQLEKLRFICEQEHDEVNLLWLKYAIQEMTALGEMARLSGRPVDEFYAAAKRRKTYVRRILAAERGAKKKTEEKA
jgi:hypothetical protein